MQKKKELPKQKTGGLAAVWEITTAPTKTFGFFWLQNSCYCISRSTFRDPESELEGFILALMKTVQFLCPSQRLQKVILSSKIAQFAYDNVPKKKSLPSLAKINKHQHFIFQTLRCHMPLLLQFVLVIIWSILLKTKTLNETLSLHNGIFSENVLLKNVRWTESQRILFYSHMTHIKKEQKWQL